MNTGPWTLIRLLVLGSALSLAPGAAALSQTAEDPDWPCNQILVPTLSYAAIWDGPPIEKADPRWLKDPAVKAIVDRAGKLGVKPADLEAPVEDLARNAGPQRNAALTAVFAGIFNEYDRQRDATIAAVKRYARQQRALQGEIAQTLTALDAAPKDSPQFQELTATLQLQRRILDDRRRAMGAVCDQPTLVEQKLGELTRIISAQME